MGRENERQLDYAYVREFTVERPGGGTLRTTFVRLVPPGTLLPADTYSADAEVDVDEDGHIVGVSILSMDGALPAAEIPSPPTADPWLHLPPESAAGENCVCGEPAMHKVEEVTDQARHPFTRYVCCRHFAALMGAVASRWCFPKRPPE